LAAAAAVVLEDESHPIALIERTDAGALQSGRVHEHVVAALLVLDEPEALGRIEKLHSACDSHKVVPSSRSKACRKPVIGSHAPDPEISHVGKETAGEGRAAI